MTKAVLRETNSGLRPIESVLNEPAALISNNVEVTAIFTRIMRSFLELDPKKRPTAAEALREPIFGRV